MAAGKITIDVDFADSTRIAEIRDDACEYWGWTAIVPDPNNPGQTIPNPVSKIQLIKQKFAQFLKDAARAGRANKAAEGSRATKAAEVDAVVIT